MAPAPKSVPVEDRMSAYTRNMIIAKAPAWMPSPGEVIVGEIIGLSMREADYGPYPVITFQKDDGNVVNLHAFHGMIQQQLADLQADLGSMLIITYAGLRKKTKPNAKGEIEEYHDYYAEDFNKVLDSGPGKQEGFTFTPKV